VEDHLYPVVTIIIIENNKPFRSPVIPGQGAVANPAGSVDMILGLITHPECRTHNSGENQRQGM
jgi:hypothetical protein